MPPAKRRKLTISTGTSLGTLLSDRRQELADAANAKAQAEQDAAKRTSDASNSANSALDAFKNGSITFEELQNQLNGLAGSIDNQSFKDRIASAIKIAQSTDEQNKINSKVAEFNSGTMKYADFKKYLDGIKTTNPTIQQNISTNMAAARTAENGRVMNQAYQDYLNGKIDIKAYQSQLGSLRTQPGQTPEDMTKISTAIDSARKVEEAINDEKTYANWQTGASTAAEAQAYFTARLSTAKTPEDIANISKYITNIKSSSDAAAKGSADAYAKMIDDNATKAMKSYKDDVLAPAVDACDGDPACVTKAYEGYGLNAQAWAKAGGTLSSFWQSEFNKSGQAGQIAASNELFKKLTGDFDKALAAATGDKTSNPASMAAAIAAATKPLLAGETSAFLTDAQKGTLVTKRTDAARQIQQIATQAITDRAKAQDTTASSVQRLYDDLVQALKLQTTSSATMAAAGIPMIKDANGNLTVDQSKFAAWLTSNAAVNAQKAFDFGNAKKNGADSDAAAKKAVDDLLANATAANTDATKPITSLLTVQFPGLNEKQITAIAAESNASGKLVMNSTQLNTIVTRLSSDDRENARLFASVVQRATTALGTQMISTGPDGNTTVSLMGDPSGISIDLGQMGGDKEARNSLGMIVDRSTPIAGTNVQPVTQGPDAITRAGGDNIRQPGPNDYDYSGPHPILKDPGAFGPPIDTTTAGPVKRPTSETPQFDMGLQTAPKNTAVASVQDTPQFNMNNFTVPSMVGNGPTITAGSAVPQFDYQSIMAGQQGSGGGATISGSTDNTLSE